MSQPFNDRTKETRRDGQVVQGALGRAEGLTELGVEPGILIVARDILQPGAQFFKGCWVDLTVLGKTGMDMLLQLLDTPGSTGHSNDGHVEMTSLDHGLQGWEDLLVGQVAGDAEKDERV